MAAGDEVPEADGATSDGGRAPSVVFQWLIGHRRFASITAAFTAGVIAILPLLYERYSFHAHDYARGIPHLAAVDFWEISIVWFVFVFVATFTIAYSQLVSANLGLQRLGTKVDTNAKKFTDTQQQVTSELTRLQETGNMNVEKLKDLDTKVLGTGEQVATSLNTFSTQVGLVEQRIVNVNETIQREVKAGVDQVERLTSEAIAASWSATVTLQLGSLIRMVRESVIDSMTTIKFPCGSQIRTLQGSRQLAYLLVGPAPEVPVPFYREDQAVWAVEGRQSPEDARVASHLRIQECLDAGKGNAWLLSNEDSAALERTIAADLSEAVTMPVMHDGSIRGFLVVLRFRQDPFFFKTNGDNGECFGVGTDVVRDIAASIGPLLAEAREQLETLRRRSPARSGHLA